MSIIFRPVYLKDFQQHPDLGAVEQLLIHPELLSSVSESLLLKMKEVKSLYLTPSTKKYCLPPAVLHWRKLHTLRLQGVKLEETWHFLPKFPALRCLEVQLQPVQHLPYELTECRQLEALNFLSSQSWTKFEGWDILAYLPRLQWLDLRQATFKRAVLEGLEELELKGLLLPLRHWKHFAQQQPDYDAKLLYRNHQISLERKAYVLLFPLVSNGQITWEQLALALNLAANDRLRLDQQASPKHILDLTDLPVLSTLRLKALEYFIRRWPTTEGLAPNAQLSILGEIASNKNEFRDKLKALAIGISYAKNLPQKSTHVLIGQSSKGAYQLALERNLPILSEKQVLDYISSQTNPYLLQENENTPEQTENISQLLLSLKAKNVQLALSFFEQGGFPVSLLTVLFYVYCNLEQKALKKKVGQLLQQYASATVLEELALTGSHHQYWRGIANTNKQLQRLQEHSELDAVLLARYIYQQYDSGLPFLLETIAPKEGAELLRQRMVGGTLKLNRLNLKKFPTAIFLLSKLQVLEINYNYLRHVPLRGLRKLPLLDDIYATHNHHLAYNRKWQDQLHKSFPRITLHL